MKFFFICMSTRLDTWTLILCLQFKMQMSQGTNTFNYDERAKVKIKKNRKK